MYARTVDTRTLTFCVSGQLWNRSLVMMDIETESLWCHILGTAMHGALKGSELEIIPGELTTWERWKRTHPHTTSLNLSRTHEEYKQAFYENPEDFLYGWRMGAKTFACTYTILRRKPVQNLEVEGESLLLAFDTDGDSPVLFSRLHKGTTYTFEADGPGMRDTQTGSNWNLTTGTCSEGKLNGAALEHVVGIVSYTRSWTDFHPDTHFVE